MSSDSSNVFLGMGNDFTRTVTPIPASMTKRFSAFLG
jgi:hypothetical protein